MRNFYMKWNMFAVAVVTLTLVLGLAVIVSADNGALGDFNAQYPGNSFGGSCNICHAGGSALNPYGAALKGAGGTGDNIGIGTFLIVEGHDADGDGFVNIVEINAGTFPGDRNDFPVVPATIDSIVPVQGTLGTQFTIAGSGFGAKKGKVVLSSDLGGATLKIAKGGWIDTLISATIGKALLAGTYDVTVYFQPYRTTSPILWSVPFTIMTPALVEPLPVSSGLPGDEITIAGNFFGTKKGKVSIEGLSKGKLKKTTCKVTFWSMNPTTGVSELRFVVPKGLDPGTYPLTVTNKVGSVTTDFTISIPTP